MVEFRFQLTMPVLQVATLLKADSDKAKDAERELPQAFLVSWSNLRDSPTEESSY